ncbi:hypothetical protein WNY37_02605 [Henriciella sp. AS95]|uniref:hypothetical protein n=1 Tax=Henriciella sp. AS95 TaxID=3135782 RepID=UPI003170C137
MTNHPLSTHLADTAKFTASHAGMVPEVDSSLPWLVSGAVLMVQQACVIALSEAGAELPLMPGPNELVARVADETILAQPFTVPLKPAQHRAFEPLVAARNDVMHPRPTGLNIDAARLPDAIIVATTITRHLALTQPVRRFMIADTDQAAIKDALGQIETSVEFWRTVLVD